MTTGFLVRTLLAGSALFSSCAMAQHTAPPIASDNAEARIARLQAQVDALQKSLAEIRASMAKATPSWRGVPLVEDKEAGWSFKPRGRLMYDFAIVGSPDGYRNGGLGFSNELRRGRLGVEGTVPGGFGYKLELDFAAGEIEFTDALLSYEKGDLKFIVGQHNNFQSLDELTSSLHSSFIERSAFTDAFGFERRVGVSAQFATGDILAQAGVFTDNINAVGDDHNGYSVDGRLVFAPKMGANQLHLGVSAHHRQINDSATSLRYRQRPAVHTTDVRFVDTGNLAGAEMET
ncbi:MAG: porin, partial [Pseudomonadota bacterium]|nr:porin [Pseudomonadota bacterium]